MNSWLDFEDRFRRIATALQYIRIDFTWGAGGEFWRLAGGATGTLNRQFEALAELSGMALFEVAKVCPELSAIVSKESDPKHAWYRALKELSGEFKMGPFGYYTDEAGNPNGSVFTDSMSNIGEVSANFCLILHSRYPIPREETIAMSGINIVNSTVGILNTGQMNNIKSIAVNIGKLNDSGLADVAAALNALTDAVAASIELTNEAKSLMLEQLESLSKQALLPEEERMKPGVLKAIGSTLSSTLAAAGGLAEVWSTWGPAVLAFFGL
jgi:hypothetical protein